MIPVFVHSWNTCIIIPCMYLPPLSLIVIVTVSGCMLMNGAGTEYVNFTSNWRGLSNRRVSMVDTSICGSPIAFLSTLMVVFNLV